MLHPYFFCVKRRRVAVGFYHERGKTKPITKPAATLKQKKVIQKAARFQGIKPKFFRAIPLPKGDTKLTHVAPIAIGQRRLFIYMCQESHDSTDAELWYRTMRPAVVIHELKKVDPEVGRMFKIRFDDGHTADANWYELPAATNVTLDPSQVRRTNPPYLGPDFTRFANKAVVEKAAKQYLKNLTNCSSGLLKPQLTDVEKVKDGHVVAWWPLQNEPPIYKRSFEKVLCFAKTPGGAIIGSVTGESGFKGGARCILGTAEQPDVDLSDEMHGDFAALGEVRYHRPVPTKVFGTFKVDAKLLKRIGKAYSPPRWECTGYNDKGKPTYEKYEGESFPDEDKIKRLRDEINKKMGFK